MANQRDAIRDIFRGSGLGARALIDYLVQSGATRRNARRSVRRRGASRTHRDVEFAVDDHRGEERIFKTFDEAAAFAAGLALTTGVRVELDVLVSSRAGAEWWGGSDAGEQYDEDPDASVFDRLMIKVSSQGRVA
jgi:hypothetical protein